MAIARTAARRRVLGIGIKRHRSGALDWTGASSAALRFR
jgi:hypothetical protein